MNKVFQNKNFLRKTEEVNNEILERIRSKYPGPIIGVIGASNPDYNYYPQQGIIAGFMLAKYCHEKGGSIYTGGVDGVGSDVFTGIALYCKQFNTVVPFFVIIPEKYEQHISNEENPSYGTSVLHDFNISSAYVAISQLTNVPINIEQCGLEMSMRRVYVARCADVLVVINGSSGTLDEAKLAMANGKDLILVTSTAGASRSLANWITNKPEPYEHLREGLFKTLNFTKPTSNQIKQCHIINSLNELYNSVEKVVNNH